MKTLAYVAALAAGLAVAGCGGSHHVAPTSSSGSANARATLVLRQLARCVRTHGMPSFPDPVVDSNGHPKYPDSAPRIPSSIQQACNAVAAQMPSSYTATVPVSNADYQKLLRFARCMRSHIADWPDPNALGEFPIDVHIQQGGKRLFVPAAHACARLNPDPSGGIDVIQARP
jgi:hypothetical protein